MAWYSLIILTCWVVLYSTFIRAGIVNRALCYNNVISCGFLGINSCTDNPVWAKKHCAAFCNICDKCLFEKTSRFYSQGDSWCDGNRVCTCNDGTLSDNSYSCVEKGCPIYKAVPYECPLVWSKDICCPIPDPNHKRCADAEIVGSRLIGR